MTPEAAVPAEETEEPAWLTAGAAVGAAWLTVEPAGDAVWLAADAVRLAADAVWLAAEVAGVESWETADVAPFRVPVTALVTALSRPPDEAGAVEATAARLVVAAWALLPDSSQNTAIKPKQQPTSTVLRMAKRPAHPRPGVTCASGAA